MANDENLIPMNRRTKSEQRKIATAGGKASGAARRKKRDMRKAAEMLLNMPVSNKQSTMKATLTALGIDEEDMDYSMGVMAAMLVQAANGNVNAAKFLRDSTLFHPSKEYLENLKLINEKYLASRGMEYNSKKTKVFSIKEGFTFLGFKYRLTDTGKVIMTVSSEKVKERRRKLRKLVRKAKRGEITKAKVDDCYQAWRSHASKGNSFHLIRRMDKFYKSLWNDQETEVTDNEN